ncbi:MAG: amino acid ABC transporter ATP-binding protein [Clostridia bacterium]|nr:amino acid ABC transporter ATP-binding protein [Clostridia bacterium]
MIEIKHLKKEYETVTPLKDINAVVNKGDVISIIGPSGTGKSTFLRCINQLESPSGGDVYFNGELITAKNCKINKVRQKMGMVFQSFNLFNHLTIIENVMYGQVELLGKSRQEAYDKSMQLLHKVGLADKALNYPEELSGGQKQRAAIARTLAMDPEVILFDEPTSALDPTMVGEVQAIIRELAREGITMMIVTHEMKFAREISNRVFYMDEGLIYEEGSPEEIFDHPKKENTIKFIRRIKVYEGEITSPNFDFIAIASDINEFGFRNQIPLNTVAHINTMFEELCMQILLPKLGEHPHIKFTAEYSESTGKTEIILKYNGEAFNIEDSDNELSLMLIKGLTEDFEYEFTGENDFANLLTLHIK